MRWLLISLVFASTTGCFWWSGGPGTEDTDEWRPEDPSADEDGDGVLAEDDCDDERSDVYPGADELCDLVDNDCDGDIDEDDAVDAPTWYADDDGDLFGDPDSTVVACYPPRGHVENGEDCDDGNADVNPDADEVCDGLDNDCDDLADDDDPEVKGATTWYVDSDGDGYGIDTVLAESCIQPSGSAAITGDCDDSDSAYNPGAAEDDCTDPADYNCDGSSGYTDDDGDGFAACEECDDSDAAVNPGAAETCNGVDDDCDGLIDDDDPGISDTTTWYLDADGDGYGDADTSTEACEAPSDHVATGGDCDDGDSSVHPGALEWCDGIDNDCDGDIDGHLAVNETTWYLDADGDGYGDASTSTRACDAPSGFVGVTYATDCDDSDAAVNPAAAELCDTVDNDCDGDVDEDDAIDASTWYADDDGDGYGDPSDSAQACAAPSGHVADSSDCDDGDAGIHPGATESCGDGVDDDCDGVADDGCTVTEYHCGAITSDETWSASSLHVITCDVSVGGGAGPTLTIEDGAEIQVYPAARIDVGWSNYGSLEVLGGSTGILMTSSASSPAPGDWDGLMFGQYDLGSKVEGLTLEYGGDSGYGGIWIYNASPIITDSVIADNDHAGIYIQGTGTPTIASCSILDNWGDGVTATSGALSVTSGASFADNVVTGNTGYPLQVLAAYGGALDASSSYAGNGDDRVLLLADTVDSDSTWQALDVPYLLEGDLRVEGGSSPELTIEDGAELQADSGVRLLVGYSNYGSLTVAGGSAGVLFTSAQSSPSAGDWDGLHFGTYDTGSSLTGAQISYAGDTGLGAIYDYYAGIELVACAVDHSSTAGLYVQGSQPAISGSSFDDNVDDGVTVHTSGGLSRAGSPSFNGNSMSGNGGHPISLPADYLGELADDNSMSGNIVDTVRVQSDYVTADASWRALDVPYQVADDVHIEGSASPVVTILDGVEMRFDTGVFLSVGYTNYGGLLVEGTTSGVQFSSGETTPLPGDWDGLLAGAYTTSCSLEGLTLEHGGGNGYGGLYLYYSEVSVSGSVLQDNAGSGIYVAGGTLDLTASSLLDNDDHGLELDTSAALASGGAGVASCVFSGNAEHPVALPAEHVGELDASSSYTGNGEDSVLVKADTVETDASWQLLDVVYLLEGDLYVEGSSNPQLTIEAGAELRHEAGVDVLVGYRNYGSLIVAGSSAQPVVFTSAQTTPAAGDWSGIQLGRYCDDSTTSIEHAEIAYGGANGYGEIYLYSCDATVTDSTVRDSSSWGIFVRSSSPSISGVSYSGNASGDLGP